ncbi:MAG TPA: response regulator, partial [Spirochaetia bacterium]|nr:response regulator [Spirochaetia bacterium]
NGTLLVVDDEVQVREVVARALTRAGYRVLEASGGRDAINAYREHQSEISLVVLDMIMPEMDGHETLVRLRQLNPDVSALFLTGYTNDTRLRELAEKGLAQVLEKPVDLRALSERVQELLRLDRESGLKHTPPIDTPS